MKNIVSLHHHNSRTKATTFSMVLCSLFINFAVAANQNNDSAGKIQLDETSRQHVITSLINQLKDGYIFPRKAIAIEQKLHENQKNNRYKNIKNGEKFAATLTSQLQQETGDKHLQVEFNPQGVPDAQNAEELAASEAFEMEMWRAHNFGIEKIERLRFNIGYFKLSAFGPVKEVGPLLASAMNLLSNMDSLVIDLRGNFGGSERTVQLLASYLLNKRTHLLNMYKRVGDTMEQHWSSDYVEGKRFGQEKDVYILIDGSSFSAAEDFSYTMKNLKRATLIGETTGGAAHSGDSVRLSKYFSLFLPTGRGISPITNTNWEGTGVIPDVQVTPEEALNKVQKIILEKLIASEKDTRRIARIKARIAEL